LGSGTTERSPEFAFGTERRIRPPVGPLWTRFGGLSKPPAQVRCGVGPRGPGAAPAPRTARTVLPGTPLPARRRQGCLPPAPCLAERERSHPPHPRSPRPAAEAGRPGLVPLRASDPLPWDLRKSQSSARIPSSSTAAAGCPRDRGSASAVLLVGDRGDDRCADQPGPFPGTPAPRAVGAASPTGAPRGSPLVPQVHHTPTRCAHDRSRLPDRSCRRREDPSASRIAGCRTSSCARTLLTVADRSRSTASADPDGGDHDPRCGGGGVCRPSAGDIRRARRTLPTHPPTAVRFGGDGGRVLHRRVGSYGLLPLAATASTSHPIHPPGSTDSAQGESLALERGPDAFAQGETRYSSSAGE